MFRTITTSRPARVLAAAGVLGLLATGCTSNTPETTASASSAPAGAASDCTCAASCWPARERILMVTSSRSSGCGAPTNSAPGTRARSLPGNDSSLHI